MRHWIQEIVTQFLYEKTAMEMKHMLETAARASARTTPGWRSRPTRPRS